MTATTPATKHPRLPLMPPGLPRSLAEEQLREVVIERGFRPGTVLENICALQISRCELRDRPEQQYRIGRYRVDFAWPEKMIALEADGWWHRSPEGATRDRERDSWLRSQGWVVLRVDDEHGDDVLADQVVRVCAIVRSEDAEWVQRQAKITRGEWP